MVFGFNPHPGDMITITSDVIDGVKPEAMDKSVCIYAVNDSNRLSWDAKMEASLIWRLIKRNDVYLTTENKKVEAYQFMCVQTPNGVLETEEDFKRVTPIATLFI